MRIIFLSICALLACFNLNGQISSFPHTEDFENFSTCGTNCGDACTLMGGWFNPSVGDDIDWTINQGGTSSGDTGPSVDHNPGTTSGKYAYTEASGSCSNSTAHMESPYFDFTNLTVPKIEFWYHMYGGDMGTMHLDIDTTRGNGAWVLDVIPSWRDSTDIWKPQSAFLAAFGGRDSVRFRLRGQTGPSFESDMAVDDFTISEAPSIDVALVAITEPVSGCGLTSTEQVSICIRNQGGMMLASGTSIPVSYSVNGGTPVNANFTLAANLMTPDSACFTFPVPADLSSTGVYSIQAWTSFANDSVAVNDSMMIMVENVPLVNTFPYQEDFESGPGGWNGGGINSTWAFGTPGSAFIPAASSGINAWVTNLAGDYNNDEFSFLVSPCFDFSTLTIDPTLRFAHIFNTESCCDEGWVEISIDGGLTWNKLGTSGSGINWYNDAGNDWWDGNSGASGAWRGAENVLTGTAGQANVRLRFIFSSDLSVTNDGFGVDDILIFDTLDDAAITDAFAPVSGCNLGAAENVSVEISNLGTSAINDVIVCYNLNGGAVVCDTLTGLSLAPGSVLSHTFSQTANLSVSGYYDLAAWTSLAGEDFPGNDTLHFNVASIPTVSSLPYIEDFEADAGFWTTGGTNSSWAWGMPAGNVLVPNFPCGGNNAWVTNLNGPYNNSENSFILSPCFNFSSLTSDPSIRFDLNFLTESCCDEGWLESSIDGGTTWSKVGTAGTGLNWYNDASNNWWDGSSNGWLIAENVLTGTAGQSDVRLRFVFSSDGSVTEEGFAVDNILVFDDLVDMQALSITSPVSSCGLSAAETVIGSFQNFGTSPVTSFNVCFTVNGGAAICETVNQTVAPGSTYVHTFTGTANMSLPGDYDLLIYPVATGDSLNCSDTLRQRITNVPEINTFPYVERYENGTGGWRPVGNAPSWAYGTPAKAVIQGAASGQNAWVSGGLTGQYSPNENHALLGPCFNFSNAPANPWVAMSVWWDSENTWDGTNLQYSIDSGATWVNVGAAGAPFNWYNNNNISSAPGGDPSGWTGSSQDGFSSGGWVTAKHPLDTAALNGQSYVLFRLAFASDGSVQRDGFAVDDFVIAEPPVLSLGPDSTVCGGYALNSGYTVGTFEWSTGDTLPAIQLSNTGTTARTDTVSLIYTDTLGLCAFDTILLTVEPAPQPDLGPDQVLCPGDSIVLDAGMGDTYLWSSGGMSQTETVSAGGTYTVTVTNTTTGCSNTDDILITQNPGVTTSTDTTICTGGTATLTANLPNGSFVWSTGDTTPTLTVSQAGTYSVTATDQNNCMTTGDVMVSVTPDAVADFSFTSAGFNYTFSDLSTGAPTTWAWDFGDGMGTSTQQNPAYTYADTGSYVVTLVVSNACGSDTLTQTVLIVSRTDAFADGKISVFPNPSDGHFNVSLEGIAADDIRLELRDLLGRTVWSRSGINNPSGNKLNFEVSDISTGIWLLRVYSGEKERVVKVIVE